MTVFAALGLSVSCLSLAAMVHGPVTAALGRSHIRYTIHLHGELGIVAAYIVATCASAVLSGQRQVAVFGVVNLVAVVLIALFVVNGFASLWCGWAAIKSAAIAVHLRLSRPTASPAQALG